MYNPMKVTDLRTAKALANSPSLFDRLEAWSYLIKTGAYSRLGKWFEETGQKLITKYVISPKGEILIDL